MKTQSVMGFKKIDSLILSVVNGQWSVATNY